MQRQTHAATAVFAIALLGLALTIPHRAPAQARAHHTGTSWASVGNKDWICGAGGTLVAAGTLASLSSPPTAGPGVLAVLAGGAFTAGCAFEQTTTPPTILVGIPRPSARCFWVFPHGPGPAGHRSRRFQVCAV